MLWDDGGCGIGIKGKYIQEMLHHCKWTQTKCLNFEGREEIIDRALKLILNPQFKSNEGNNIFSGITLALIGKSGTGKTSLMSKLAQSLVNTVNSSESIITIIRFCGTSESSRNAINLVTNICLQKSI